MSIISIQDKSFLETAEYQNFMAVHPGKGNLKIHAYAASEALPVGDLSIVVSTKIGEDTVVFFEGKTDASGMVPTLSLPTPPLEVSNLEVPLSTTYDIVAGSTMQFHVSLYDGICVVQNINYVPGGMYGN